MDDLVKHVGAQNFLSIGCVFPVMSDAADTVSLLAASEHLGPSWNAEGQVDRVWWVRG